MEIQFTKKQSFRRDNFVQPLGPAQAPNYDLTRCLFETPLYKDSSMISFNFLDDLIT